MTSGDPARVMAAHTRALLSSCKKDALRLFHETLRNLPPDLHIYTAYEYIRAANNWFGIRHVRKELMLLPDTTQRSTLLCNLISCTTYGFQWHEPTWTERRVIRDLINSERIRVEHLDQLLGPLAPYIPKVAERALLMVPDDPPGLNDLFHRLIVGYHEDMKADLCNRVISALIGLDSAKPNQLMYVAQYLPEHRRAAATVALHRGGLTRPQLALLLSYPSISDLFGR